VQGSFAIVNYDGIMSRWRHRGGDLSCQRDIVFDNENVHD
jgi:hypothetical protein